jgi:hypothetical protein
MVVNFRAREISRGAYKLARTSTLNKKKKNKPPLLPSSPSTLEDGRWEERPVLSTKKLEAMHNYRKANPIPPFILYKNKGSLIIF